MELLRRMARLESPSLDAASQAPVQEMLAAELRRLGLETRRHPGRRSGGILVAHTPGWSEGQPHQLLLGHSDTVWPAGTLEHMPVRRRGGRLYGPGVYDMKGGLVQISAALGAAAAEGELPLPAVVLVNSDEEIGSAESTPRIRGAASHARRVLVLEPSLGPEGRIKTSRKGGGELVLRVRGRAAHAGLEPEKGASAILALARAIERVHALAEPERGITLNVGLISGGSRPNVVAAEAAAVVDVRVRTRSDARRVERAIRSVRSEVPGTRLAVEGKLTRPPLEPTSRNQALWRQARRLARDLDLRLKEGESGGSSDGNTASLYAPTLDGLGPVGDGAHAPHEHVVVESLVERSALLARLLLAPPLADDAEA